MRIRAGEIGDGLIAVQNMWKEIYPDDPFNYSFIDEAIKEQYQQEGNLGQIVTSATILSIVIGSLGLFGLSALTMTARMKEISIRKVLGATLGNLIFSLGRSYLFLTLASTLIAAPITIYFISNWLKTFEYKIGLEPYIFIAGGSIAILICLFTIAYQAIKIALSNPIGNLRTE
jgi:putative ABC transport system permease protein